MKKRIKNLPLIHRVFAVQLIADRAAEPQDPKESIGQGRRYHASISSEQPATQWYWELGYITETLSHKKSSVLLDRLKAAGPLLWMHDRYDQVGRIHDPSVAEGQLAADFRFSRTQRGQDMELDAVDDIKVNVSIGYQVKEMKLTRRGDPTKGEIDEYTITQWEPHEVSIVSIPADISVGLGRQEAEEFARRSGGHLFPAEIEDDGDAVREEREMKLKKVWDQEREEVVEVPETDPRPAVDRAAPPATPAATTAPAAAAAAATAVIELTAGARDAQVVEINQICKANEISEAKRDAWIRGGLSPEAVCYEIQKLRATPAPAAAAPAAEALHPRIDARELEKYSLRRAILMTIPKSEGGIEWGGLEADVHNEIDRNLPIGVERHGGIFIPNNIKGPDPRAAARAARTLGRPGAERAYPLDSVTATEGTEFKFTQAAEFIDMLRAKLITTRLGVRFLANLPGPMGFPRKTGSSTPTWQTAEAAAVADSMPAFEQMVLSPKTLIDTTGTSRQLLRMASEDMEALLRDDILKSHRVAIDTAFFVGTGAAGQPSGLYVLSGIQSYDIGPGAGANAVPDYVDITSMIGLLGDANADDGNIAFALTPLLAATLMRTLTFPSANTGAPIFQVSGAGTASEGSLGGYRALASNVLSKTLNNGVPTGGAEHGIVLGDFSEGFIGEFGGFEIIADPYSSKKSGVIELTSFQMIDVNVRHQASFVKGINAIP